MLSFFNKANRLPLQIAQTRQAHISFFRTTVPIRKYAHVFNDNDKGWRIKEQYIQSHKKFNQSLRENYKKGLELYNANMEAQSEESSAENLASPYFAHVLNMSKGIAKRNLTCAQRIMIADSCVHKAKIMSHAYEMKCRNPKEISWDEEFPINTEVFRLCFKAEQMLPLDQKGLAFEEEISYIKFPFQRGDFDFYRRFSQEINAFYNKGFEYFKKELSSDNEEHFPDYENALLNFNRIITLSEQLGEERVRREEKIIVAEAYLYKATIFSNSCHKRYKYKCQREGAISKEEREMAFESFFKWRDEVEQLCEQAVRLLPEDKQGRGFWEIVDCITSPFLPFERHGWVRNGNEGKDPIIKEITDESDDLVDSHVVFNF